MRRSYRAESQTRREHRREEDKRQPEYTHEESEVNREEYTNKRFAAAGHSAPGKFSLFFPFFQGSNQILIIQRKEW